MAKFAGDEKLEVFKQSEEKKMYEVMFKQNRSFELHLAQRVIHFFPYETQKITEAELRSPEFVQQKYQFTIKGEV